MDLGEMVVRLLLAFVAGGVVGFEREQKDRPAGLRTHMLVSGGSALFTIASVTMAGPGDDRTRIAAQVVSGIGFLGAGTIFRSGTAVRGLTTAAGLWTVAAIGVGIGAGGATLWLGLIAAVSVLAINRWVRNLEYAVLRAQWRLIVKTARGTDVLARVVETLEKAGAPVDRIRWLSEESNEDEASVELRLMPASHLKQEELAARITDLPGVRQVDWD